MNYIVYKTTNIINGKIYIGVHYTNPDIFDGYIGCGVTHKDSKKNTRGFPAAVLKYGYSNFKRQTLKIFPDTTEGMLEAYKYEAELVTPEFVKSSDNYNLTIGGKITMNWVNEIEIAQYTLDGVFIRTWPSIKKAQQELGLTSIYNAVCCRSKYCGDFQWKYYLGKADNIEPVTKKEKVVYQFDLLGNLLKIWKSITEASKEFKNQSAARSAISNVCNKKSKQAYGYYWSFKRHFDFEPNGIAVAKYNDEGFFIESYTSIAEAAKENKIKTPSNITAAIKGLQKRCGGFRWRFFIGDKKNIKPLK